MQPSFVYRFTRHARNRMLFWRLAAEDVIAVLNFPAQVLLDEDGRWLARESTDEPFIEVAFVHEPPEIAIITVAIIGLRHRPPRKE